MAYVNVKDWSVDRVTEWLKGVDNVILPYAKSFLNNGVTGDQLLHLRADDLENLGVEIIGHQEIILEAVEHLRNFHYELDKENLQVLALRLCCAANSVYKELQHADETSKSVETQTMSAVHDIISAVKPFVGWLTRSPFFNDKEYVEMQTKILKLCFEMALSAHRDIFSEKPITTIKNISEVLVNTANYIIQEIKDPLILQPASLDLTTIKKKEQELGFYIYPSNHSVHQISDIIHGTPAHLSRKIEEGDEIVQVNYQTVVGWQRKNVMYLLRHSPPEVLLTLKKQPQHTKVYGPIYMKPYRLPSKKRSTPYSRWNENLPSPGLLSINDLPQIPLPKPTEISSIQELGETYSDSDTDPPDSPLDEPRTLYPLKSRPVLQRRNTVTGVSPINTKAYPGMEQFLQMCKHEASLHSCSYHIQNKFEDESTLLRDKSASCSHGLELTRPTTVIGITQNRNVNRQNSVKHNKQENPLRKKKVIFEENKKILKDFYNSNLINDERQNLINDNILIDEKSLSVNSLNSLLGTNAALNFIDEAEDLTDRSNMITKDSNEDVLNKSSDSSSSEMQEPKSCDRSNIEISHGKNDYEKDISLCPELREVHVHNIIKKFDDKVMLQENNLVINSAVRTKIPNRLQLNENLQPPVKPKPNKKPKNITVHENLEKSQCKENNVSEIKQNTSQLSVSVCEHVQNVNLQDNVKDAEVAEETNCELGVPLVEFKNTQIVALVSSNNMNNQNTNVECIADVPPKPPPRTSTQDSYKPKYPADSPKPVIEITKRQLISKEVNEMNCLQIDKKYNLPDNSHKVLIDRNVSLNSPKLVADTLHKPDVHSSELQVVKKFEPKVVSTPISKTIKTDVIDDISPKNTNTMPVKSASGSKISPTNSIVRAMIYSSKGKHGKKKNTLTARKRKVSVSDVSPGDLEGYLYQRFRHRDGQKAFWDKLWFVLIGNRLYGFTSKDAQKADVLIYLTGFTVSIATEVKSRSNAFKVYHTGTVFYFSAENMEATMAWIEMITAATLHSDGSKPNDNILYSETDDSDNEKPKTPTEKTSDGIKKFGSLKKFTSKKISESTHSGSTSLDRKWFFNKSTSAKYSVPVPTAQFRSYRKIQSSPLNMESVSTGNFTSHIPNFATRIELQPFSSPQNVSVPNLSIDPPRVEKLPSNPLLVSSKIKSNNFSHASNPSLYNVNEFNSSFFHKPQHQVRENLTGFVTLEELMNRQNEEQKLDPHLQCTENLVNADLIKPDVVYGEVPIRPKEKTNEKKKLKTLPSFSGVKQDNESSSCFGKRSFKKSSTETYEVNNSTYPKSKHQDLKNNMSLPRTHKLLETYHDNVQRISSTKQYSDSCKSLTKIEDLYDASLDVSYEKDDIHNIERKHLKHSINRASMEALNNAEGRSTNIKLKSAMQYTPLSLPLTDDKGKMNAKLAFELNLDEKSHKSVKLKNFFHKPSDPKKEKTLLGSPKLHRAIFRKHNVSEGDWNQQAQLPSPQLPANNSDKEVKSSYGQVIQHIDYPGLEYPPVFEPETYSLSDPQSSLTILRKQGKNN